jgi:hypothetical protein
VGSGRREENAIGKGSILIGRSILSLEAYDYEQWWCDMDRKERGELRPV